MVNGVYIDIFPIDKVSQNRIIRIIDNLLLSIIYTLKISCTWNW